MLKHMMKYIEVVLTPMLLATHTLGKRSALLCIAQHHRATSTVDVPRHPESIEQDRSRSYSVGPSILGQET